MRKEKTTIVRVNTKDMDAKEFRQQYVTLGQRKDDHEKRLVAYAKKFLKETYNTNLTIPIKISGRLTASGGYFKYWEHSRDEIEPTEILMSERFIASASHDGREGLDAILDVLKHELVHYVLCKQGKNFDDGEDDFESELARLNIGASGRTSKKLVKSKKLSTWYKVVDIYEQQSYDIINDKHIKYETYRNHTQKPKRGNRVAYEVVKSYH